MSDILQVYGYWVPHEHWSKIPEVRSESVSEAWRSIETVHLLDGHPDPQKPRGSSSCNLDLRLSRQLRTYSFQDPLSSLQNPAPLGIVVAAARNASYITKDKCLTDLVQIGFYFCLRSCEYTKTNLHRRTTQFRLRDIQFQDICGTIPFDAPDYRLLNILVVTLFLDTQKNYIWGESIYMEKTHLPLG